jgi:hypothetical protein
MLDDKQQHYDLHIWVYNIPIYLTHYSMLAFLKYVNKEIQIFIDYYLFFGCINCDNYVIVYIPLTYTINFVYYLLVL